MTLKIKVKDKFKINIKQQQKYPITFEFKFVTIVDIFSGYAAVSGLNQAKYYSNMI